MAEGGEAAPTHSRLTTLHFSPPGTFSFKPEDWQHWFNRFSRYRRAVRLDLEDEDRQVDALLYAMGEESEVVFSSLNLNAVESTSYTTVVSKLNDYYLLKHKRTFERQRFYDVAQGSKTVEEFETELHAAAKYCEFVDKTEQLCHQFVRGLNDAELKHRQCLADKLTLEQLQLPNCLKESSMNSKL